MAAIIHEPTTCKLCGEVFYGPKEGAGGGAVVLGEEPNARALRFTQRLLKHLEEKHTRVVEESIKAGASFAGMLKLIQFDIKDELMHQQAEYLRWWTHQKSIKMRITDQRIVERVEKVFSEILAAGTDRATNQLLSSPKLFDPDQLGDKFVQLLREMRDILEETNTPKNPFMTAAEKKKQATEATPA